MPGAAHSPIAASFWTTSLLACAALSRYDGFHVEKHDIVLGQMFCWYTFNFWLLNLWTIHSNGKGEVDHDFSYDEDDGSILLWLALWNR